MLNRYTIATVILTSVASAAGWQAPLPVEKNWSPLTDNPVWKITGIHSNLLVSSGGIKTGDNRNLTAEVKIPLQAVGLIENDHIDFTLYAAGRSTTAVWAALGEDNFDVNNRLDGAEYRIAIGLDRGRWGIRQCALGDTVWETASLPPDGKVCSITVRLNSRTGQLMHVSVSDAAGQRQAQFLQNLNLGWVEHFPAMSEVWWRILKINLRGAEAQFMGFTMGRDPPSILIVR